MKFISVRQLAASFELEFSNIDDELIDNLRKTVDQHFTTTDVLQAFNQDFTFQEVSFILDQLKEEDVRLFHDWVDQDFVLSEYLVSNGNIVLSNEEIILPKKHRLFVAYQSFLSTYLAPILFQKTTECICEGNLSDLGNQLIFSPFLPKIKRIEIQQPVSVYLKQLLAQLKMCYGVELQKELKTVYSYPFVHVLNKLDDSFYTDAKAYVNSAKLIVQNNELNILILDEIRSNILSVQLKDKDRKKILEFCNSDAFTAQQKAPRSSINDFVRSPLFFVGVIAIVINVAVFYPRERRIESEVENDTSEVSYDSLMNSSESYYKD